MTPEQFSLKNLLINHNFHLIKPHVPLSKFLACIISVWLHVKLFSRLPPYRRHRHSTPHLFADLGSEVLSPGVSQQDKHRCSSGPVWFRCAKWAAVDSVPASTGETGASYCCCSLAQQIKRPAAYLPLAARAAAAGRWEDSGRSHSKHTSAGDKCDLTPDCCLGIVSPEGPG